MADEHGTDRVEYAVKTLRNAPDSREAWDEAIKAKNLKMYADLLESIAAERDTLRAEVERLRGVMDWLASDDTGLSSEWMAHVIFGVPVSDRFGGGSFPYDTGDFGRCYRFLQKFPQARESLHKLRASGPVWSGMVDRWDELERLYDSAEPTSNGDLNRLLCKIREDRGLVEQRGETQGVSDG
jgi:hypothetical protein